MLIEFMWDPQRSNPKPRCATLELALICPKIALSGKSAVKRFADFKMYQTTQTISFRRRYKDFNPHIRLNFNRCSGTTGQLESV